MALYGTTAVGIFILILIIADPLDLNCPMADTSHSQQTKHLYTICTTSAQRLRRWSNIVQMLYKVLVWHSASVRSSRSVSLRYHDEVEHLNHGGYAA